MSRQRESERTRIVRSDGCGEMATLAVRGEFAGEAVGQFRAADAPLQLLYRLRQAGNPILSLRLRTRRSSDGAVDAGAFREGAVDEFPRDGLGVESRRERRFR